MFTVLVLFSRTFLIEPGIVNGMSMEKTFIDEEVFLINKITLLLREPKRYDMVQFFDKDSDELIIKRVIGLPGEQVYIKKNSIFIIDKHGIETKLNEPYLSQYMVTRTKDGAVKYDILEPNKYFLLGDNRVSSTDSRTTGPIHRKYILGTISKLPFKKN
jgi:signal peptidase I